MSGEHESPDHGVAGPVDTGRTHEPHGVGEGVSTEAGLPGIDAATSAPPDPDPDLVASPDLAAAAALARARAAARDKGLRPGSRPVARRRRPTEATYSGTDNGSGGRDPLLLGEQLDRLLVDRGWNVDVSVGSVMGRWPVIVGPDVARHCTPVTFDDGVLVVRAESTAWATQLRYMTSSLLARLEAEAGPGVVASLRIVGPSAPSWSKGPRRATGPGPRDTYG